MLKICIYLNYFVCTYFDPHHLIRHPRPSRVEIFLANCLSLLFCMVFGFSINLAAAGNGQIDYVFGWKQIPNRIANRHLFAVKRMTKKNDQKFFKQIPTCFWKIMKNNPFNQIPLTHRLFLQTSHHTHSPLTTFYKVKLPKLLFQLLSHFTLITIYVIT